MVVVSLDLSRSDRDEPKLFGVAAGVSRASSGLAVAAVSVLADEARAAGTADADGAAAAAGVAVGITYAALATSAAVGTTVAGATVAHIAGDCSGAAAPTTTTGAGGAGSGPVRSKIGENAPKLCAC